MDLKKRVTGLLATILMGSMIIQNSFIPASVRAEGETLVAGTHYDFTVTSVSPRNHTYVMPKEGYFNVSLTTGDSINEDGTHSNATYYLDISMYVNGELIAHEPFVYNGEKYTSKYFSFPKGTVVDIKVAETTGFFSGTIIHNYSMDITSQAPKNFEIESNDTKKKADIVKKGKTYKGLLMSYEDDDWYVFKAPKKGKYHIALSVSSAPRSTSNFTTEIWKGSKRLSEKTINYGAGYNTVFSGKLKKGQKLYIKCYNHDSWGFGGNLFYNLKVKKK